MAVASDLPDLENRREYQDARNSVLFDRQRPRARRADQQRAARPRRRTARSRPPCAPRSSPSRTAASTRTPASTCAASVAPSSRTSIQRRAAQGGSTITQQFVKNALRAQSERTVFQKLREAALAFHLTRKWPKKKILTQYLNAIYFGNGAYGIEAAARTYFGTCAHRLRRRATAPMCAAQLAPHEAALLAGIIASPSGYDPVAHPVAAKQRRDLVLARMLEQGRLTQLELFNATREALPAPEDVKPPQVRTKAPYFTTWVRQQLVDRYGARRAFEGGLRVDTTLDLAAAGGGREGGQRPPGQPRRAGRRGRGDRQRHGRGARDGRRARLQRAPVQPRHAGPAPARLGLQAVHPRHRAAQRDRPGLAVARRASASSPCPAPTGARSSSSTTSRTSTPGSQTPGGRADDLRQRRLRRGRHPGRDAQGRGDGRRAWASARRSRPTRR